MFGMLSECFKPTLTFWRSWSDFFKITVIHTQCLSGPAVRGEPVRKEQKYRRITASDWLAVFVAVKTTMVGDIPKHDVFTNLVARYHPACGQLKI